MSVLCERKDFGNREREYERKGVVSTCAHFALAAIVNFL